MTKCAVVLAAGVGTRFNTKGSKVLTKIKNVSIIERLIKNLIAADVTEIYVVVGYDHLNVIEEIKDYGVAFVYNPLYEKYGQMYSFSLVQDLIPCDILLLDGDLIISTEDIKRLSRAMYASVLVDSSVPSDKDMGAMFDRDGLIALKYGEGNNVWMSISKLTTTALKLMKVLDFATVESQSSILNYLATNKKINVIKGKDFWRNVNTKQDLATAKEELR
jgi:choline kinase